MQFSSEDRANVVGVICGFKRCGSWDCPLKYNGTCMYRRFDEIKAFSRAMDADKEFRKYVLKHHRGTAKKFWMQVKYEE